MKTIDIIILAYNQEDTIERAINSVLSQKTNCMINIFVNDDASTDNTLDKTKSYGNQIKTISNPTNQGASLSLLNILKLCKGDYISLLEADDYWVDSNKLQKQIDFLEQNSQYVACGCDLKYSQKQRIQWIRRQRKLTAKKFNGVDLCFQTSTLFMRNIGFNNFLDIPTVHPNISDRAMQMILLQHGDLYRLPDKMVLYQVNHASSVTKKLYVWPCSFFLELSLLKGLSDILQDNYNIKNEFVSRKLVVFGNAYLYYIFGSKKKIARKTIKDMWDITKHTRFWKLIAPIAVIWACAYKLLKLTRAF